MGDFIAGIIGAIIGDAVDLLPKPLRIGCWVIVGLFVAVIIALVVVHS